MTDSQLLTLVVSLSIPLALLIYSNSKVQDAKEVLRAEQKLGTMEIQHSIADLKREVLAMKSDVTDLKREIIDQFTKLDLRLRSLERHRDN